MNNNNYVITDGYYIGQIDSLRSQDVHGVRIDAYPWPVNVDDVDKPELDAFDAWA